MTKLHVVFQTHWDREWYFPFEQFRHRLTRVMERIVKGLEEGEIERFILDGQMAALEDYFEVCEEEQKQKVLKLIKEGRMIIGPWYVLADEFLVSGESLIRNMEIGLKQASELGNPQMVGYLPDTFGHISQMPQLLQGFGIDNAVLWRGLDAQQSEVIWKGTDGSRVFTVFLPEGYYQQLVDAPDYQSGVTAYVDKVKEFATTKHLLLTNGGDHLMPRHGDMSERLSNLSDEIEVEMVTADLESYIKEVREDAAQLKEVSGELRSNRHCYVLPNVLSARTYLKEQNQRAEDELTGYTEPLMVLASKFYQDFPGKYVENTWKLLLKNHPHDSICGCSVDEVHREMENRNMKLMQRLNSLQEEALERLDVKHPSLSGEGRIKPFADHSSFVVFNPHPFSYSGWINAEIRVNGTKENKITIKGPDGEMIKPAILSIKRGEFFESPHDGFPEFKECVFYEAAFQVNQLAGVSLTEYTLDVHSNRCEVLKQESYEIQNDRLIITLEDDGTVTLQEKESGKVWSGLHQLYSSLDAGDEYNYSPPRNDLTTYAELAGTPVMIRSEGVQKLEYRLELIQPEGLNEQRSGPSHGFVKTKVNMALTLYDGDPQVHATAEIDNQAKDQRLRAKFPLGVKVESSYSDTGFDLVKREARKTEEFDAEKQREVPVVVEPSYSMISANNGVEGLNFFHRGLQEYQLVDEEKSDVLEITLLRSVGWLSRDDLRTRGGGAGPRMETPEAQCLRNMKFKYSFSPFQPLEKGEWLTKARELRLPPKTFAGKSSHSLEKGLITISNNEIQWSSLRNKQGKIELRIWNPTDKTQEFNLASQSIAKYFSVIDFNGSLIKDLEFHDGICQDSLKPKEIRTYSFSLEGEK